MIAHRFAIAVAVAVAALAALAACRPTTDLVVPPPPRPAPPPMHVDIPEPRADGRLPDGIRPRRYRLALDVDPAAASFRGEVRIELDVEQAASAIVLHGSHLTIDEVEVTAEEKTTAAKASFRMAAGAAATAEAHPEELVIEPASPIAPGSAQLRIAYHAPLAEKLRGLYRVKHEGKSYAFTQLEPADARRMMPCFDDPGFKTPFEISVTVPQGNRVFSNAQVARERDAGEDADSGQRTRVDFAPTEPIPSYLVALAIGPLEVLDGKTDPVPVRFVAPAGRAKEGAFVSAMTSDLIALAAERFGRAFPYPKLDLVAVPAFGPGAMENAGLITFRQELVLIDDHSSAHARRLALQVTAHELAHQWFGDLVTLRWWDDLWLNEGMASYWESVLADGWRADTRAELEDLGGLGRVMDLDALDAARRVRQPVATVYQAEEGFDAITYSKGAAVLAMIHVYLGDEAFRLGIKTYLGRHAGANAGADDLFRALGDAAHKDVAGVASSFVDQPGVPLVRVKSACQDGKGALSFEQRRYRLVERPADASAAALWKVPVCVRYQRLARAKAAEEPQRVCTLLGEREAKLELDRCPAWVLPNDDYRGYYRFSLPAADLQALWRATLRMDARAKVGFLSNAWALVQAGELGAGELIAMLGELKGEREREVVEALVDLVQRVDHALIGAERVAFEAWAAGLLEPIARDVGWDAKKGDAEDRRLLRHTVLDALAVHTSDAWLYGEAHKRAAAYLRDPGSVDADSASVALRAAAHQGGVTFEALTKALAGGGPEHRVRVLQALGSFSDAAQLERALGLTIDGTLPEADHVYVFRAAADWHDGRRTLIAWLEKHLPDLVAQSDGMTASLQLRPLAHVCDAEAHAHAEQVFRPLVTKVGGSERRLAEALEASAACVDLRRRQGDAAAAELSRVGRERRGP